MKQLFVIVSEIDKTILAAIITSATALFMSAFTLVFSLLTSSKKYELTTLHRKEIMTWYSKVNLVLVELKLYVQHKENIPIARLATLSSLIEDGRFLFPNIIKKMDLERKNLRHIKGIEILF